MSDFFLEHNAYAANGILGATVVTFGMPQEGDGSAKAPSSASSVATVTLTGNAAVGNALLVCGITLTAVASGATVTQFVAGANAVATADNIATAINACTSTVAAAAAIGTPQLRNLVYARGPALRGSDGVARVDIMMRVGSASLNYANNSNVLVSSSGWTPTIAQFSGGVGGCWGTLINTSAAGVASTYAAGAYGYASATLPFVVCPNDAPTTQRYQAESEWCWLRSGNGYTLNVTSNFTMSNAVMPQNLVLDSNLKWTEDSGDGLFTVRFDCNGQNRILGNCTTKVKTIAAVKPLALRFVTYPTNSLGSLQLACGQGANTGSYGKWHNVFFGEEVGTGVTYPNLVLTMGGNYCGVVFQNCKFSQANPRTAIGGGSLSSSGAMTGNVQFDGCEFEFNHTALTDPGPILAQTYSGSTVSVIRFSNCSFKNLSPSNWSSGKYLPHAPRTAAQVVMTELAFDNCTGLRLDNYMGIAGTWSHRTHYLPLYYFRSGEANGAMRYETMQGVVEWNPDASPPQPLLYGTLPNGTPYSLKIDWMYIAGLISEGQPYRVPALTLLYRDTTAIRTINVEMMVRATLDLSNGIGARVRYIDSDGNARSENTRFNPNAVQASTAVWTNASGFPNHTPKKMVLTTKYPIKQETEVSVDIDFYTLPPSGVNEQIYLDPGFTFL